MPAPEHPLEALSDALVDFIEEASDWLAAALSDNGRAPFAANTTEADKLRYYTKALWNDDGSPNVPGRQKELRRLGPAGYAAVFRAVEAARMKGPALALEEGLPAGRFTSPPERTVVY